MSEAAPKPDAPVQRRKLSVKPHSVQDRVFYGIARSAAYAAVLLVGMLVPARTPRDIVTKLNQAFVAALNSPEAKTRFAALNVSPVIQSRQVSSTFLKNEAARYGKVIKDRAIKPD